MLNIMVCCANGAGTSLMMKMTADKVVKALNIKVGKMHHCSLSEGKSAATQYDIVFCPLNFIDMFKDAEKKGTRVILIGEKTLERNRRIVSTSEIISETTRRGIGFTSWHRTAPSCVDR